MRSSASLLIESMNAYGAEVTVDIESLTENDASLLVHAPGSAQGDDMAVERWVLRRAGDYLYFFVYRTSEDSLAAMESIFKTSIETIVVQEQ